MKRLAIESLEERKNAMISGFWANDGMNDDKGTRTQALEDLESQFKRATEMIRGGKLGAEEDQLTKADEKNPFLAPAIKATREIETVSNQGPEAEVAEPKEPEVDQH